VRPARLPSPGSSTLMRTQPPTYLPAVELTCKLQQQQQHKSGFQQQIRLLFPGSSRLLRTHPPTDMPAVELTCKLQPQQQQQKFESTQQTRLPLPGCRWSRHATACLRF
jgi:hypothetical protein